MTTFEVIRTACKGVSHCRHAFEIRSPGASLCNPVIIDDCHLCHASHEMHSIKFNKHVCLWQSFSSRVSSNCRAPPIIALSIAKWASMSRSKSDNIRHFLMGPDSTFRTWRHIYEGIALNHSECHEVISADIAAVKSWVTLVQPSVCLTSWISWEHDHSTKFQGIWPRTQRSLQAYRFSVDSYWDHSVSEPFRWPSICWWRLCWRLRRAFPFSLWRL